MKLIFVTAALAAPVLPVYYNDRYNRGSLMHMLKLTQIGNSIGVILPKEALNRMRLEKGQTVFLTETPEGYALTPYDPTLEEQIQAGREFMREFRDTFHQLAK